MSLLPAVQTPAQVYSLRPKLLKPDADNQTRLFQTSVALALGLNEAIFLQQLNYRLRKPSHVVNGVAWYEASYATLKARDFPFWCTKTIARTAWRLEKQGFILAIPLSRNTYDRTKWYTINDEKVADALGCTSGQTVPLDAPACPPLDQDTLSPSLKQEEKREKRTPDASLLPPGKEETSPPQAPPPPVTADTQDGQAPSTALADPSIPAAAHTPAPRTDDAPVAKATPAAQDKTAGSPTPRRAPAPHRSIRQDEEPAVRHTIECPMTALKAAVAAWPQDAQALTDLHTLQTTNPGRYHQLEQAAWEVCLQRARGKRENVFGPDLAFTMLDLLAGEDTLHARDSAA